MSAFINCLTGSLAFVLKLYCGCYGFNARMKLPYLLTLNNEKNVQFVYKILSTMYRVIIISNACKN